MDADRFDSFARALTAAGSRRGALGALLGGTLGLLGARSDEAEAHNPLKACKKKSGKQKKKCVRKAKAHNATHAVKAPPPTCPAVCPVCQTCQTTSLCGVQASQNGQAGNGCAAPQVCCSGSCCDGIHQCNAVGACTTCAEVCPENCAWCVHTTEGHTLCGGNFSSNCQSCMASADCTSDGYFRCMESYTDRSNNFNQSGICGSGRECVKMFPCT